MRIRGGGAQIYAQFNGFHSPPIYKHWLMKHRDRNACIALLGETGTEIETAVQIKLTVYKWSGTERKLSAKQYRDLASNAVLIILCVFV